MNTVNKEQRLDICKACEHYWERKLFAVCKKCGCVASWKASLEKGKCPVGKW